MTMIVDAGPNVALGAEPLILPAVHVLSPASGKPLPDDAARRHDEAVGKLAEASPEDESRQLRRKRERAEVKAKRKAAGKRARMERRYGKGLTFTEDLGADLRRDGW